GLVSARVQVTLMAGQQVVDAEHLIAAIEKSAAQMRANEARSSCHQGPAGCPRTRAHSTIHRSTSRRYDTSPSGLKNNATSLAADCGESEPWIRLRPISRAKSPRIVPGAASAALVAPIVERMMGTAFGPSKAATTTGPAVI